MGITQAARIKSLQILQKMVYAKAEEEFEQLHNLLKISAPKRVIEYFDKNWYPIKYEWSMSKNFIKGCFQNTTNNRIESINAKLMSVITKNSTLVEFVHSFFSIISSLESERDFKAIYQLQKRLVTSYLPDSDEQNFLSFLTHETGKMVIKQIELSKKVKVPSHEDNDSCFVMNTTEGQLRCQKSFAHNYCDNRVDIEPVFGTNLEASATPNVAVINKKKPQTYGQKRRKALITTDSLANLVAISSNESLDQKIDNLKCVEMLWKQDKRARIVMINEDEEELPSVNENENSPDFENMPIVLADTDMVQIEVISNVSVDSENISQTLEDVSNTKTASNEGSNIQAKTNSECYYDSVPRTIGDELKTIRMPQKIKKRGRPKESDLTTIGLPKRKKGNVVPFFKIPFQNKQKRILTWFVDEAVVALAMGGSAIEEESVETIFEIVPHTGLHENLDMNLVRDFFSDAAWQVVQNVILVKRQQNKWLCVVCNSQITRNQSDYIMCTLCLLWRHVKCTTLKKIPKYSNKWICSECKM